MKDRTSTVLHAAMFLGLVTIASCGGDEVTDPRATTIASITLSRDTATVIPGVTVALSATVRNELGNPITRPISWTTSNGTRASVSLAGVVTGVAVGTTVITATAEDFSDEATITVSDGAVINQPGGSINALLGRAQLTVPAGAVSSPVMITIANVPTPPAHVRLVGGTAVELGPNNQTFTAPLLLRLRYETNQLPLGASVPLLRVHRVTGGAWEPVAGGSVDAGTRMVNVNVSSFSTYGIMASASDQCLFSNAVAITVGETLNGAVAGTDCLLPTGHNADIYRITLASPTNLAIRMASTQLDAFLTILNATTGVVVAENDDRIPFVDPTAQVVASLPAGTYIVRARTFGAGESGPYVLTFPAGGSAATIAINAGNAQKVAPGSNVSVAPSVIVRDEIGFPVPGVTVTFANVPTVGTITGALAVTGPDGIATLGSWNIAEGANVLSATATGGSISGNPVIFSAMGVSSTLGFNIDLRFLDMPNLAQLTAFNSARAKWESIILGDLVPIPLVFDPASCTAGAPNINELVDDLLIQVRLGPIDGENGILGNAGPCLIRTANTLPVLGTMRFDTADLPLMEAEGALNSVVQHEMGHVLGIGSLWTHPSFSLIVNPSLPSSPGVDTHFTGPNAITGFDLIGGTTYTGGAKVPVENSFPGAGSRDSHWREGVLVNELMTPAIDLPGANPLSVLSVLSLQDLGYQVNINNADPFSLVLSLRAGKAVRSIHLVNDIRIGPVYRVDAQGRVVGGIPPR